MLSVSCNFKKSTHNTFTGCEVLLQKVYIHYFSSFMTTLNIPSLPPGNLRLLGRVAQTMWLLGAVPRL